MKQTISHTCVTTWTYLPFNQVHTLFLEIAFVWNVGICVCAFVCVFTPTL